MNESCDYVRIIDRIADEIETGEISSSSTNNGSSTGTGAAATTSGSNSNAGYELASEIIGTTDGTIPQDRR